MSTESIARSSVFGDIKIVRGKNWSISADSQHLGQSIEIAFLCDNDETLEKLLSFAEGFWKQRELHFKTFEDQAVVKLLQNLNDCLDRGQTNPPNFTETEFRQFLRTPSGLTFLMTGLPSPSPTCIVGAGNDPRLEHEYIQVFIGEDGVAGDAEIMSLL